MARNTTVDLVAGAWTQLTAGDVLAATVVNLGGYTVYIKATVGAVAPTNRTAVLPLAPGHGISSDLPLSAIWSGLSGANRIYAYCDLSVPVMVSHA